MKQASRELLSWLIEDSSKASALYSKLISESANSPELWDFVNIAQDHERIVNKAKQTLQTNRNKLVFKSTSIWPEIDLGLGQVLFKNFRVLSVLRSGEMAEIQECQRALREKDLDLAVRSVVQSQVIPMLKGHVATLDRFISRVGQAESA